MKIKKAFLRSLLIFFILLFVSKANAQIIYTDIVPDYVDSSIMTSFNIDLNNDGFNDFQLYNDTGNVTCTCGSTITDGTKYSHEIHCNSNAQVAVIGGLLQDFVFNYFYLESINSSNLWNNNTYHLEQEGNCALAVCSTIVGTIYSNMSEGQWNNATDGYLGVRIFAGADFYSGWIRLDVDSNSFTVKDYAYNTTPNQSILAGDMGSTGITKNTMDNLFYVSTSGTTTYVNINQHELLNGTIKIKNTLGQEIKSVKITDALTKIEMSDFMKGIYFINLIMNGKSQSKKVVIY